MSSKKKGSSSAPAEKQQPKKAAAPAKAKRSSADVQKDYAEHPKFAKFKKGGSK